ncbi:proton pump-interactor BIP131 [Elaeis guineensis]|uniref:Proton pump-interactor BIP131 n=1 Tax=Elaeis guineensis var. tenera TaxID=51953 RepID=A0A6I9QW22_ELAGV|nr:proton pump-interactor BIP131 [Elaeis guineensis]
MGVEVVGADVTSGQVKGIEGNDTFLAEMDSKTETNLGQEAGEPIKSGLGDNSHGTKEETKEADHVTNANFPKDAVDEWPAPQQFHTFYFVKFRSYEDPKLKAKIEQTDKDIQKKNQTRFQITEALKAKRSERANVISQLKPLTTEDKQYRAVMDEKRKEIKPLQTALGKLNSANNVVREKGLGLCSSEEELNDLIKSLQYRISHESISLDEEKQLMREIKQLEGTRGKVIANAAMRAKIQDTLGQKEAIQDQVKVIGGDIDGVRKEQQSVRAKIKQLEEELKAIDEEISSLQEELTSVTEKRNKAFETLTELRKARDEANACYYQNRSLLNNAKELAAKKDLAALEGLSHSEVEKFMSQWSSNKSFREDYERRILPSLDIRQLSRDGRMRNPDEKPIILEATPPTESETMTPLKANAKRAKEAVKSAARPDAASTQKAHNEKIIEPIQVEPRGKVGDLEDIKDNDGTEKSQKELSKSYEIDAAKLKEMKREEEIAKAKLAMERKKKLAEKAAARAAARAHKEAEKKLKEKEKKAKKKVGPSVPATSDEQIEMDAELVEPEEADVKEDDPIPVKAKEQKQNVRYRNLAKSQNRLPKVILKRKKSQSYWSWAVPATILALVLLMLACYFTFWRN